MKLSVLLLVIFGVSVLVNSPWELAQSPLYVGMDDFRVAIRHCLRAALGDGVLVLLIYGAGWLALRRMDWFEQPGTRGYLIMFGTGLAIGISVEWVAVHVAQRWAYTDQMPHIPVLEIGMVPVVQMLVLPPLIFRAVAAIQSSRRNERI